MGHEAEVRAWDARYEQGQYDAEPPLPFVSTILAELGDEGIKQAGLYVGCGNGRNYIPLLEHGLNLRAIDISQKGIEQLIQRYPQAEGLVRTQSFDQLPMARVFDYLVAIQVFQHGSTYEVNQNFRQAHDVLKPGGKLFLRVNSVHTQVVQQHHRIENNKYGGFSIVYDEGPKKGGTRHFFDHQELEAIAASNRFDILKPMSEVTQRREPPLAGTWSQWETIWRKQ